MSPLPVFQLLLQDNPNLFTTEGLSALLEDCIRLKYPKRHKFTYPSLLNQQVYLSLANLSDSSNEEGEIIRRILSDPKGWCLDAPAEVNVGAKFYDMGKMFGPGFGTDLFLYHTVRDNIQQLQKSLGISGVRTRNISVRVRPGRCRWRSLSKRRHRLFSYPALEDQLVMQESDRVTLQQAAPEIIKYFISLVQMPLEYRLFLVDEKEQKIPTSVSAVENAVSSATIAEISTESFDWELTGANCWRGKSVERLDPDEILLIVHLDWSEKEFIFFEAQHPNLSRFPWTDTTAE
ncbi:hypothetical protein COO91_09653 (plasmid) [Nostoc flagelliforme CCNUN1]|uniref:Uncharacterized protein n=1 Tax=Nostoc flagelliforme CCNUN1 TaxID=2038116 RepID=A0A2K8T726_9NOSO|nr:hypothetical protein [Nostoc flagelliforme]AUB43472.1 hypothetical protein COO91_09653 [Nostoc flagelliforme CCNUN1]